LPPPLFEFAGLFGFEGLEGEDPGVWAPVTVTVGFGELGGDCTGLLAWFVGWAFVGPGEGLSVGEGDVRI
jgi:hypothetical protein